MSYDFWSSKDVKARKPYTCDECSAAIAVGELHNYGAGKTEGELVSQRLCLRCHAIIHETFCADFWDGEGFPMGEVRAVLRDEHGIEDAAAWAIVHRAERLVKEAARDAANLRAAIRHEILGEIGDERRRQIEVEGWTPEHDDAHAGGELADAAACYAATLPLTRPRGLFGRAALWPWSASWWKPQGRRRDLVKAAALIVAELERLDRRAGGQ